jgi:hypothetical protein
MKRAIFLFSCIFLLLAGQQVALVHSVWHLGTHAPVQHRHDAARAAQDHQGDGKSSQSRLCDLHSALGTLLAGDCGSPAAVIADTASHHVPTYAAARRVAQLATTPPSRAPPVLL